MTDQQLESESSGRGLSQPGAVAVLPRLSCLQDMGAPFIPSLERDPESNEKLRANVENVQIPRNRIFVLMALSLEVTYKR